METLPSGAACAALELECIKGTGAGLACAITTGVDADSLALTREVSLESLPMATKATITTMSPSFFIPPSQASRQGSQNPSDTTPDCCRRHLLRGNRHTKLTCKLQSPSDYFSIGYDYRLRSALGVWPTDMQLVAPIQQESSNPWISMLAIASPSVQWRPRFRFDEIVPRLPPSGPG